MRVAARGYSPRMTAPAHQRVQNVRHEPYSSARPRRSNTNNNTSNVPSSFSSIPQNIKSEPLDDRNDTKNESEENDVDENSSGSGFGQSAEVQTEDSDPDVGVKLEAVSEEDLELEITGVEPGVTSPNVSMDGSYASGGATGSPADIAGQSGISK